LETIQHIAAACEQLAPTEYVKRHDGVATVIHQKLAEAVELTEDKSPYHKYTPANVLGNNFKLYWNRSIITDKTIPSNRPDITFTNKRTKTTYLIHIAVPNTHNLAKTVTDKQNKYQELANEICAVWKQNTVQVISSTRVIPKSLPQSLKRQPASKYIHTKAKICNSWYTFNCKKLSKP
jgi:hypothetical protein